MYTTKIKFIKKYVMVCGVKCFLKSNKDSSCVLIIFKTLIYIVDQFKNNHIGRIVLSKTVLVMIQCINYNRKVKQLCVKHFLKNFR